MKIDGTILKTYLQRNKQRRKSVFVLLSKVLSIFSTSVKVNVKSAVVHASSNPILRSCKIAVLNIAVRDTRRDSQRFLQHTFQWI